MQSPTPELIPDHVIEEILLKLPAKSLIRFQCLSKLWRDRISDSSFARTHLQHNKTYPFLVAIRYRRYSKRLIIDWNPDHSEVFVKRDGYMYNNGYFDVVGSCDGILCITTESGTTKEQTELVFWNLTIRKHKTLSVPKCKNTTHGFAFGYDSSIDDYKIVQLTRAAGTSVVSLVEVLAMKSNQWRRVSYDLPGSLSYSSGLAVSLNGALYWHSFRGYNDTIVHFDLGSETFSEVSLPVGFTRIDLLGELQGKLCCTTSDISSCFSPSDIWVLKDDSWVKLFTVSEFIDHSGCFIGDRAFIVANYFGTFYIDDMKLKNNQNLSIPIKRWWPVVTCAQSLVSPLITNHAPRL